VIVWTDIESTGLDENKGHLLEVALVATDDDLNERTFTSVVVRPVGISIGAVEMPLVVREMHEKSGLLKDVADENVAMRLYEGEQFLVDWLASTFGRIEDLLQVPLAGSTIGFDRRWLSIHMPNVQKRFNHRSIDVSSFTELASRWAPSVYANRPKQEKGVAHRALEDVRNSIEYLRYYRQSGFIGVKI
jgi:oligoribonuclease (3'-5' exoribonuclease)